MKLSKTVFPITLVICLVANTVSGQIITSRVKVEETDNITEINGIVGIGTSSPDPSSGLHMYQDRYTLYGPNSTWGAYLQVGGNGRTTNFASVTSTNGNLHLDSEEGHSAYINHYSKGNTYLNTQGGIIGVGTSSPNPSSGLHMYQDRYTLYGPNSTWGAYLQVGGNGRTTNFASVTSTNGNLHLDSEEGHSAYINHYSQGNTYLNTQGGNVGIGTSSPNYKLDVVGTIHASVSVTWPDYVFDKNYSLNSLEKVENHIAKEGHLPNIPSAIEVEKNGINLVEMDSKLLQKIEELTLYLIEQNKKIEELQKEVSALKNE